MIKKLVSVSLVCAVVLMTTSVALAQTDSVTATVLVSNVSVTLDQTTFDYGTMSVNTASSTLTLFSGTGIVATNSGNVASDFDIQGAATTGSGTNWTLSGTAGADTYVHQFCNDTDNDCSSPPTSYTALTTSLQSLDTSVASSGTVNFQLRLTTPTSVSDYNQQSAAVTIQASAS